MPDLLPDVLTVSELNRRVRSSIERALPVTWVGGEISNLTLAPSGHWYFTLKDANAAVRCAMFRNRNQFVDWRPTNGIQVEVRAQATLYEPRGEFQLSVDAMRRAGLGALFEAFARLKDRLGKEGLFDPARKRTLRVFPGCIGIVTSPRAAALRDVLTTLRRRWPLARVVLYPTPVQGTGAAAQIATALAAAAGRRECDVLLLVRGGGSIEDLWAFNEEIVARAISACPMPVVSGIGHETDFTIADFVADLRAPTPTGAAQLATPDGEEFGRRVEHLRRVLDSDIRRALHTLAQRLDGASRLLRHPAATLAAQRRHLGQLAQRLRQASRAQLFQSRQRTEWLAGRLVKASPQPGQGLYRLITASQRLQLAFHAEMNGRTNRLAALALHLRHLNPEAVLGRGYAIARDVRGTVILDSRQIATGDRVGLTLARGSLDATVVDRLFPPEDAT